MSNYASRNELVETIKETIRSDYNRIGLPTDPKAYNMAGIYRDLGVTGGHGLNGWSYNWDAAPFGDILRANLRKSYRPEASETEEWLDSIYNEPTVSSFLSDDDGAYVIQVDTNPDVKQRVRVYLNEATLYDGDPETDEPPGALT